MTLRRTHAYGPPGLVCAAALMSFAPGFVSGGWSLESAALHATAEAFGAAAAIIIAILLLQRAPSDAMKRVPVVVGLLGMGILDGFHAMASPGQGFVFLHSMASVVGGLGFSLCWLPPTALRSISLWTRWIPGLVTAAALTLGLVVLAGGTAPLMVQDSAFTTNAEHINYLAGALFLVSVPRFLLHFRRARRRETLMFACTGLLFGLAGLMFARSLMWDDIWWSWHVVRLAAFFVLLWLIISEHRGLITSLGSALDQRARAESELREVNAQLERRVREQTAELRQVLQTLPIGVWILGENGRIQVGNPPPQQFWGGGKYGRM